MSNIDNRVANNVLDSLKPNIKNYDLLNKLVPFESNTLTNNQDQESLFFRYKKSNENIGIVNIKKNDVFFRSPERIYDLIYNFYKKGVNTDYNELKNNKYQEWQQIHEMYCKASWISSEYVSDGKFKYPFGAHYVPYLDKWELHPGGIRQIIYYLFGGSDDLKVVGFNTNGISADFDKIFYGLHEIRTHFDEDIVEISTTAQYTTLIPHIHFDQPNLRNNLENKFNHIKNFWETTYIKSNFDLSEFGISQDDKQYNNTLTIDVDGIDVFEKFKNRIKALLLMPFIDESKVVDKITFTYV